MRKCKLPLDDKQWNRLLKALASLVLQVKGNALVESLCLLDSGDLLKHVLERIIHGDK